MSRPSKMILPPVGSSSRAMQRAIVDLPQPDSPTTPSVSPAFDREADAVDGLDRADLLLEHDPLRDREVLLRFSTTSSSLMPSPPSRHAASSLTTRRASRSQMPCASLVVEMAAVRCARAPTAAGVELGQLLAAAFITYAQRGLKRAAGGRVEQRRRLARDLLEPLRRRVEPRQRAEQPPGVRHARGFAKRSSTCASSTTRPAVHDDHVVGELGDDAEIVRDHDDRHLVILLQAARISRRI